MIEEQQMDIDWWPLFHSAPVQAIASKWRGVAQRKNLGASSLATYSSSEQASTEHTHTRRPHRSLAANASDETRTYGWSGVVLLSIAVAGLEEGRDRTATRTAVGIFAGDGHCWDGVSGRCPAPGRCERSSEVHERVPASPSLASG